MATIWKHYTLLPQSIIRNSSQICFAQTLLNLQPALPKCLKISTVSRVLALVTSVVRPANKTAVTRNYISEIKK
jgi:hypothetical protein